MKHGTIQWYNHNKGYGYIKAGDDEYFVHYSAIKQEDLSDIDVGQDVSFQISQSKNTVQAKKVSIDRPGDDDTDDDESSDDNQTPKTDDEAESR